MALYVEQKLVDGLIKLANDVLDNKGVYIENYVTVEVTIFSENILDMLLSKLLAKDVGTNEDYPRILPQKESLAYEDIIAEPNRYKRICLSKKYNSIIYYTCKQRYIDFLLITDIESIKKVKKILKKCLSKDESSSIFRTEEFDCDAKEFIEIIESKDEKKVVDIVRRKMHNENLVFDENSTIVDVIKDIQTFFTKETKDLYKKLQIAYKRGLILYGEPGNGKSAMIREMIRVLDGVKVIIINPGIPNIIKVLQSVIKSLNGTPAIIVIEDIDSIITDYNRSELLNILDGVDVKSGLFFIGTTNYYEKIDPAFMNRSGRFDKTYKIENPTELTRKLYFESRDVETLFSTYPTHEKDSKDADKTIVDLFVKYSDNMPMANLKELITGTAYTLATNKNISVEEAVTKTSNTIVENRKEHTEAHKKSKNIHSMYRQR